MFSVLGSSNHSNYSIQSLRDSITGEPLIEPIKLKPCQHIFNKVTADNLEPKKDKCPLCNKKIIRKRKDRTVAQIVNLVNQINASKKNSTRQQVLAEDLGKFAVFNPVKCSPCGHVIEKTEAEKLICCHQNCGQQITRQADDVFLDTISEEIRIIVNESLLNSRSRSQQVNIDRFDNEHSLAKLTELMQNEKRTFRSLKLVDCSGVTRSNIIVFLKQFPQTIKELHILLSPRGVTKSLFKYIRKMDLEVLSLRGSRTLVDDEVINLISCMKLKYLGLEGCGVTRDSLTFLKRMTSLEALVFDKTLFNDDQLSELEASLPKTLICRV